MILICFYAGLTNIPFCFKPRPIFDGSTDYPMHIHFSDLLKPMRYTYSNVNRYLANNKRSQVRQEGPNHRGQYGSEATMGHRTALLAQIHLALGSLHKLTYMTNMVLGKRGREQTENNGEKEGSNPPRSGV